MSAVNAPAHILLTGGTGFVGAAILENLLNKGFTVRATVRSLARAEPLSKTFAFYIASNKLSFAVVPDMTVPEAFSKALQGIDGVVHAASPLPPSDPNADPSLLIDPAVKGTTGVLADAAKVPSVKRIVVTSSMVTILEPKEGSYTYTEADWFDTAPKLVEQYGAGAPNPVKYIASKVLAEHAAWDWVKEHKPSFELVTVMPPWTWGKSMTSDPTHFRNEASNFRLLSAIPRANAAELDLFETTQGTDVQDIAEAHTRALTVPEAAGERFSILARQFIWQDVLDILHEKPVEGVEAPKGNSLAGKNFVAEKQFANDKAIKILGLKYRPLEDTVRDTLTQGLELGWNPTELPKVAKW